MPRETGNHQGRSAEVFASNSRLYSAVHRTIYGSNVGFFSLSAADLRRAYRDFHCSGPGRTCRRDRWSRSASATLPKVAVPELLDPQGEPQLVRSRRLTTPEPRTATTARRDARQLPRRSKPTGDLAAMVAQLRATPMPAAASSNASPPASISNRRASRSPASSPSARSSPTAPKRRPLSRRPIAACCSSAASSRSSTAIRCRRCRAPAGSGRRRSRSPRSSIRASRNRRSATRLFFHARYVSPGWRLKRVASIGNHIFYR